LPGRQDPFHGRKPENSSQERSHDPVTQKRAVVEEEIWQRAALDRHHNDAVRGIAWSDDSFRTPFQSDALRGASPYANSAAQAGVPIKA